MGARSLLPAHEGAEELVISGHRQICPCCGHLPPPAHLPSRGRVFGGRLHPPKPSGGCRAPGEGGRASKSVAPKRERKNPTVFPRQLKNQVTLEYYREGGKGKTPLPSGIGVIRATQGLSEKKKIITDFIIISLFCSVISVLCCWGFGEGWVFYLWFGFFFFLRFGIH